MQSPISFMAAAMLGLALVAPTAWAAEYHVAQNGGSDEAAGDEGAPWATIGKCADVMVAGDSCVIHEGVYREWVDPKNGGSSDEQRITYRSAEGENVTIKGSEQVSDWTVDGETWKAVVPNSTFTGQNPYSTQITGDYLTYGSAYHLGDVYLSGEAYSEVLSQGEVSATEKTWYASVDGTNTTIWANFGASDPNAGLAEINVRKYVISPSDGQTNYITISGLNLMQAATQWAPPTANPQEGLIFFNFGLGWIVENNHITDSKSVCVSGGLADGSQAYEQVGHHIIRNNTIQRCGQAGVAGSHGLPASLIEGNLIEEINPTMHFGGYESAGIKIHSAIDVVIRGNVIRHIHSPGGGSHLGIWIDWQGQNTRLTGNVIYDAGDSALVLEADHGPLLMDNNVFSSGLWEPSEHCIWVHNLMFNMGPNASADGRTPSYFNAHTTQSAGTATINPKDDRYFNNIYVQAGTSGMPQNPGYQSDYNVYYESAGKTSWGDTNSVVNGSFDAAVTFQDHADGVTVTWNADTAPVDVLGPVVTSDLMGVGTLTGVGMETPDGDPITIDTDIMGAVRDATHPTAGPLEASVSANSITLSVGADGTGAPSGGSSNPGAGGSASNSGGTSNTVGGASSGGTNASGGSTVAAGGSSETSGGAGGSILGSNGGSPKSSKDDAGCACRAAPGAANTSSYALVGLLLGGLGVHFVRTRQKPPLSLLE